MAKNNYNLTDTEIFDILHLNKTIEQVIETRFTRESARYLYPDDEKLLKAKKRTLNVLYKRLIEEYRELNHRIKVIRHVKAKAREYKEELKDE